MLKGAILQCDEVLEEFQPQFGTYGHMVENLFTAINAPVECDVFNCLKKEYPENISDYDFYITTGSKVSVYDDLDWIKPLVDFVTQCDQQKIKFIGICFGHQIIALALGAQVNKSPKGWGIGIAQNNMCYSPTWMSQTKQQLNMVVSHQDQVENIPISAKIIASTDFCPNFMLQWNNHFLSIQGHPEWSNDYSRTIINHRKDSIPSDRVKTGLESLKIKSDSALFTQWIIDFVNYD